MQVVGLIHDLGKLLYFLSPGIGQWSVVGDTFPVGCAFSEKIVYPDTFVNNPDVRDAVYGTKLGVYEEGCGLDRVMLSWGHDEVRICSFRLLVGPLTMNWYSISTWSSEINAPYLTKVSP